MGGAGLVLRSGLTRLKTCFLSIVSVVASGLVLISCAKVQPPPPQPILQAGSAKIELGLPPGLPLPQADVVEWVRRAEVAVTRYLGRFPGQHLLIVVHNGGDQPIGGGVTHGDSRIDVRLGSSVTVADLNEDWIMTHEMFHLAFPTLNNRYLWMMEGLSDYLEPIARARVGQLAPAQVWKEFVEGLPQGLPVSGGRGLDDTRTRQSIYWGGNLYWLLADARIRAQTDNRRSVDDAIRAIFAEGGTGGVDWPLNRVLAVGGQATGTTALKDTYDELGPKPGTIDLRALWKKLGVKYDHGTVSFDDSAPWAKIRAAITAPNGH